MKKLTAIVTLALSLAACQPADQEPIKIGFVGPLTGDAASYGVDTHNGVKMQVDAINAAGGIGGRQIQLIAEDGRCTGGDAASAAQKLINVDKVVAIVGGACSGETLAMAPIAEAAGVIVLSPTSSSPDVTDAGDFIFRDYPSDALKTKAMAAYFAEQGFTKIAIISENTDFATGFRNSLVADAGEEAFVFNESVDQGVKDYRSLLTRLQDIDFDVFVANGQSPATIAAMVQQMRELGIEQQAITHDAGQTAETIVVGGEGVEGLQAINVPALDEDIAFGGAFLEAYGAAQAGIVFAGTAYDAMGVLAQAIASVGTDGAAIRDYLYQLPSYDGVVGTFSFDENGDVEGIGYVLIEVRDGEWVELQDIAVD